MAMVCSTEFLSAKNRTYAEYVSLLWCYHSCYYIIEMLDSTIQEFDDDIDDMNLDIADIILRCIISKESMYGALDSLKQEVNILQTDDMKTDMKSFCDMIYHLVEIYRKDDIQCLEGVDLLIDKYIRQKKE